MAESSRPPPRNDSSAAGSVSSIGEREGRAHPLRSNSKADLPVRTNGSSNDSVRLAILSCLTKKPLGIWQLIRRTSFSGETLEDELRLLIREGIVIARDKKYFVRNIPKAMAFLNLDRRFGK